MNKLRAISYCLFVLSAIMFASAVVAYWQSLYPPPTYPGCLGCGMHTDYKSAIFMGAIAGLVFAGFGAVVLYADFENKKVARRSRADIS